MSALQAIPTELGLSILSSHLKESVTQYALVGSLTFDATELNAFYTNTIETSYFDENGVLTFILNLPIETHFDEYLHQIQILDTQGQIVIECATPKVALAKGIGGMVTLKAAVRGSVGEVVFKSSDFITTTEIRELFLPEHRAEENPHPQYMRIDANGADIFDKILFARNTFQSSIVLFLSSDGDDNNDGKTNTSAIKTLRRAFQLSAPFSFTTIVLDNKDTFELEESFYITNRVISFCPLNSASATLPKIVSKQITISGGYISSTGVKLINSLVQFYKIDIATSSGTSPSSEGGFIKCHSMSCGYIMATCCKITMNNDQFGSARSDSMVPSYSFYSCTITQNAEHRLINTNYQPINISMQSITFIGTSLADCIYPIKRDSNGVPRNITANFVI